VPTRIFSNSLLFCWTFRRLSNSPQDRHFLSQLFKKMFSKRFNQNYWVYLWTTPTSNLVCPIAFFLSLYFRCDCSNQSCHHQNLSDLHWQRMVTVLLHLLELGFSCIFDDWSFLDKMSYVWLPQLSFPWHLWLYC